MTDVLVSTPVATLPLVRSLLSRASREGKHPSGVLGIRARPVWSGETDFNFAGLRVEIRPCTSALAVRDALRRRRSDAWLVVLTDRDESDLGVGITSRFAGGGLRNANPWDAVQDQFGATSLDRRLVMDSRARELANGVLAVRGETPWPPARGGFLTLEHVCAVVANRRLGLPDLPDQMAAEDVLRWAADPARGALIDELRSTGGDALVAAVLGWLAAQCGAAAPLVEQMLVTGRVSDIVPIGLAGRAVLGCTPGSEPWVLLRVQQFELPEITAAQLTALVTASERVTDDLLAGRNASAGRQAGRVLARADVLVRDLRAAAGTDASDLLRSSLTVRLASLGEALWRATERAHALSIAKGSADASLIDPERIGEAERAYDRVVAHTLSSHAEEMRVPRALAGVRLARWLSASTNRSPGFIAAMHAYRDVDAWVDRAYSDAWRGVADEELAQGLRSVLTAARQRRAPHDQRFATELAEAVAMHAPPRASDVVPIEELLPAVVLPLARTEPLLLIVADGMSAAVGTEIVDDLEQRYDAWLECLPDGARRRVVAVSGLPSLTIVSRCSLLSGAPSVGGQDVERAGFGALLRAAGLTGRLFHKLSLESSGAGTTLSPEVASAIDDTAGNQVVGCVLNTIDDALDRSDPGIEWTADTVSHLRPLLERARRAGRIVVLTSDHGHVVERREGRSMPVGVVSSNRSRPVSGGPAVREGEVRFTGDRVLQHDGDAVLAVDEQLRYGPMKAGYHGGAAPAEVVVPVHVLTAGSPPAGWTLAVPQAPLWWYGPGAPVAAPAVGPAPAATSRKMGQPTLFDEPAAAPLPAVDLAAEVIASAVFAEQRARAQRVPLDDSQVAALLRQLVNAPGHRVDSTTAAIALGVPAVRLAGAIPLVQRLLNVEQYSVISRESDGGAVVLDLALLQEQFGVRQ